LEGAAAAAAAAAMYNAWTGNIALKFVFSKPHCSQTLTIEN